MSESNDSDWLERKQYKHRHGTDAEAESADRSITIRVEALRAAGLSQHQRDAQKEREGKRIPKVDAIIQLFEASGERTPTGFAQWVADVEETDLESIWDSLKSDDPQLLGFERFESVNGRRTTLLMADSKGEMHRSTRRSWEDNVYGCFRAQRHFPSLQRSPPLRSTYFAGPTTMPPLTGTTQLRCSVGKS